MRYTCEGCNGRFLIAQMLPADARPDAASICRGCAEILKLVAYGETMRATLEELRATARRAGLVMDAVWVIEYIDAAFKG